jgi:hypothetical protein
MPLRGFSGADWFLLAVGALQALLADLGALAMTGPGTRRWPRHVRIGKESDNSDN